IKMVKVLFPNASLKQSQEVEVSVGDFVSISEYDVALIEDIVSEITAHEIKVKSATFVSGAYPQCDYSALENLTEYTFLLTDVCDIKTNANLRSPVDYLHKVIADNATKVK
ncbi:hypothetical protein, partial [Kurthia sp. Dielmo]|uniref:hypothetical protein n=1 Tax=Kurthia sp. Dielmo TaxID=1033738 RepID=UPI001644AD09